MFYYEAAPRFSDETCFILEIHLQMDYTKMVVFHPLCYLALVFHPLCYLAFMLFSVERSAIHQFLYQQRNSDYSSLTQSGLT